MVQAKLLILTLSIVTYRNFSGKRSKDDTFSPIEGIVNCESLDADFSNMFRDPLLKQTRHIFSKFLFILNSFTK